MNLLKVFCFPLALSLCRGDPVSPRGREYLWLESFCNNSLGWFKKACSPTFKIIEYEEEILPTDDNYKFTNHYGVRVDKPGDLCIDLAINDRYLYLDDDRNYVSIYTRTETPRVKFNVTTQDGGIELDQRHQIDKGCWNDNIILFKKSDIMADKIIKISMDGTKGFSMLIDYVGVFAKPKLRERTTVTTTPTTVGPSTPIYTPLKSVKCLNFLMQTAIAMSLFCSCYGLMILIIMCKYQFIK